MTKKELIECSASLLGGAGIGAALMYLLDPELGDERREYLAKVAADSVHGTGDSLSDTWHNVADYARDTAHTLADRVRGTSSDVASHASEAADDYSSRARDYGSDWLDSARSYGNRLMKRGRKSGRSAYRSASHTARSYLPESLGGYHETSGGTIAGLSLAAVGCLAFGAGLMYFLDPERGRGRRAWARDKTMKYARETGQAAQGYGKYAADHLKGYAHETRSAASAAMESTRNAASSAMDSAKATGQQLVDKVKGALGKITGAKNVNVNDNAGRLTLTGSAAPTDVEVILTTCRTAGASDIDNRINTGTTVGSRM